MDDIDRNILRKLQENARATLSDLSGEASLSIPAVSERLKKLNRKLTQSFIVAVLIPEPTLIRGRLIVLINKIGTPQCGMGMLLVVMYVSV